MKKLKTLKLTQLNKEELKKQELNSVKGGRGCNNCDMFSSYPPGAPEVSYFYQEFYYPVY